MRGALVLGLLLSVRGVAASEHERHAAAAAKAAPPARNPASILGPVAPYSAHPMPAFDPSGRLFVAFVEAGHVYVTRSVDGGKTFAAAVKVNPEPETVDANGEARPKVAVATDGTVYVTWTRRTGKSYSGVVRFSRSSDGGSTFAAPVTLNDDVPPVGGRFDTLSLGPEGEVMVAWIDKRDRERNGAGYAGAAVYYAVSRDRGRTFEPNRKLKDHACECCRMWLAREPGGTPVLLWRDILPGGIRDHSLSRFDGSPVPKAMRATDDGWKIDGCPHHGPALSIGSDGVYHSVWFTGDGVRGRGAFYARSTDQGRTWSTPTALGSNASAQHPTVLAVGTSVTIAWKESRNPGWALRGSRSTDSGVTWSAAADLAVTAEGSDHPQLVARDDSVLVSWLTARDGYLLQAIR